MASTTLLMVAVSVRSRRLSYFASCAGSVVNFQDYLVCVLTGASAQGAPALLTDFLAIAYAQYLGAGATPAAYNAAQQQAAALFVGSPLVQALYNLKGAVPPPVLYPGLNQPPTCNVATQPATFPAQLTNPGANPPGLSNVTDLGPIRTFIRYSGQKVPNLVNSAFNSGPPVLASPAAGGSNVDWSAEFTNLGGFPGQANLVVQAPTGPLGSGGANIPSGAFIDIEYGASIDGR